MKENEPNKDKGLHIAVQHKNEAAERMTLSEDFADRLMQRIGQEEENPKQQRFDWMKIAASVIGILFVSGIAFAAIHMIRHNTGIQEPQPKEQKVRQQAVLADNVQRDTANLAKPVVFNNVTLDSIAKGIAAWYNMDMDLQNEQACQLRFHFIWKPNDSLQEVIEKLNMFEHVDMAIEDGKLIVR